MLRRFFCLISGAMISPQLFVEPPMPMPNIQIFGTMFELGVVIPRISFRVGGRHVGVKPVRFSRAWIAPPITTVLALISRTTRWPFSWPRISNSRPWGAAWSLWWLIYLWCLTSFSFTMIRSSLTIIRSLNISRFITFPRFHNEMLRMERLPLCF